MMKKTAFLIFLFAAALVSASAQKIETAEQLISAMHQRYAGKWYEIARYPNKFQKDCAANTTANYLRKDNGRIEVRNE